MTTKTTHSVTGVSATAKGRRMCYWADFTTGTGVGTAQFQVQLDSGDWIPADAQVSAGMSAAAIVDFGAVNTMNDRLPFRWNVTISSGSIITYMQEC